MNLEDIKETDIYKKTLKDERFKRILNVYVAVVATILVVLLGVALRNIAGTADTIRSTQIERAVNSQESIRIAVSAAVACAAATPIRDYSSVYNCVVELVKSNDAREKDRVKP